MEAIHATERVFLLDLEDPRNLDVVEQSLESLIEFLAQKGASFKAKIYVFLDEIHNMKSHSRFLKLSVVHHADKLKIICTGSSALGIK